MSRHWWCLVHRGGTKKIRVMPRCRVLMCFGYWQTHRRLRSLDRLITNHVLFWELYSRTLILRFEAMCWPLYSWSTSYFEFMMSLLFTYGDKAVRLIFTITFRYHLFKIVDRAFCLFRPHPCPAVMPPMCEDGPARPSPCHTKFCRTGFRAWTDNGRSHRSVSRSFSISTEWQNNVMRFQRRVVVTNMNSFLPSEKPFQTSNGYVRLP